MRERIQRTQRKQTQRKPRKRKLSLRITEKKYRSLISHRQSKRKMSLKDKKLLDDALYTKYCMCLKKLEGSKKGNPYPICMNSIYLNRGFKAPTGASRNCKKTFNK